MPAGPEQHAEPAIDLRYAQGVQIGDHNTQHIHVTTASAAGGGAVVTTIHADAADGFVGRAPEVELLLGVLAEEPGRTGTVVVGAVQGMGGIGKTALTRHAAAVAVSRDWFSGGAVFVDLRGYDADPAARVRSAQVFGPMSRALGVPADEIPEAAEQPTAYHQWLDRLAAQGRRVLLVLDNAAELAQVRDLLPNAVAARVHRVLITSRDTLPVPGAVPLELGMLTAAEATDLLRATLDAQAQARRLAADPRPGAEPDAVAQVVDWCGRLPLAVVIAAGVLAADPDLDVTELARELADTRTRLASLDDGTGGVHTAFVTSWRRLRAREPAAAQVLCLLTAAPGPDVDLTAAAALAGIDPTVARVRLRVLTRAHLLLTSAHRWSLHDLVRLDVSQHAVPDLPVAGAELAAATERLLAHYLDTAAIGDHWVRTSHGRPAPRDGRFTDRDDALAWLDAEQVNVVAAVTADAGDGTPAVRDRLTVDLAAALVEFLSWRRQVADRIAVTEAAVRAARRLGDALRLARATSHLGTALLTARQFERAIIECTTASQLSVALADTYGAAVAVNNLGLGLRHTRRFADAVIAHSDARDLYRAVRNRHGEAMACNNLGTALHAVRRFDEAIDAYTAAADLHRAVGDRRSEAESRSNQAVLLREQRRFAEAAGAHRAAMAVFQEAGDQQAEGEAWNNLGLVLQQQRRFDEAVAAHTTAAGLFRDTADQHGEATALAHLGLALQRVGRLVDSLAAHTTAADAFLAADDAHGEAMTWANRAGALVELGRLAEAVDVATAARDFFRTAGDRNREAAACANLSMALRQLGRFADAITAALAALEAHHELGDTHGEAMAWNHLGMALARAGKLAEAATAGTSSVEAYRQIGDRHGEAEALAQLGFTFAELGRRAEARQAWQRAVAGFAETGQEHDAQVVRQWLAGLLDG